MASVRLATGQFVPYRQLLAMQSTPCCSACKHRLGGGMVEAHGVTLRYVSFGMGQAVQPGGRRRSATAGRWVSSIETPHIASPRSRGAGSSDSTLG